MADASRLVDAMRKIAEANTDQFADLVVGKVLTVSPLVIQVDRLRLTSTFLTLSPFAQEKVVKIADEDVVLWEGLAINDSVYMLKCGRGQKFYVLQRRN